MGAAGPSHQGLPIIVTYLQLYVRNCDSQLAGCMCSTSFQRSRVGRKRSNNHSLPDKLSRPGSILAHHTIDSACLVLTTKSLEALVQHNPCTLRD